MTKNKVATSSNYDACDETSIAQQRYKKECVVENVPDNLVLESVFKYQKVQPSYFYYKGSPKTAPNDNNCFKCATRLENVQSSRALEPEGFNKAGVDASQLSIQNKQLLKEVDALRKSNKALKAEKVLLNTSLQNLKQQFNFVVAQQESAQQHVSQLLRANSLTTQRLNFSEHKLEQYITAALEHENQVQDLSSQLAAVTRKYEAEIASLKLAPLIEKKHSNTLNMSAPNSLNTPACSIAKQAKQDTFELHSLKSEIVHQSSTIKNLLVAINCLFKDRSDSRNWQHAKLLLKQHRVNHLSSSNAGLLIG